MQNLNGCQVTWWSILSRDGALYTGFVPHARKMNMYKLFPHTPIKFNYVSAHLPLDCHWAILAVDNCHWVNRISLNFCMLSRPRNRPENMNKRKTPSEVYRYILFLIRYYYLYLTITTLNNLLKIIFPLLDIIKFSKEMHLHFGTIRFVDTAFIVNKLGTSNDLMKHFVRKNTVRSKLQVYNCSDKTTMYMPSLVYYLWIITPYQQYIPVIYLPILPLFQLALYQREYPMEYLKFHRQAT